MGFVELEGKMFLPESLPYGESTLVMDVYCNITVMLWAYGALFIRSI